MKPLLKQLMNTSILSAAILFSSNAIAFAQNISIHPLKGTSGAKYNFYQTNGLAIGWQITRPSKAQKNIKLCIPSAFTTKSDTVVGIYAINGKTGNRNAISKPIGGVILIENGSFKIFPTRNGAVFTKNFLSGVEKRKATMFQQYQIVTNGSPASFRDKKYYQMRAIVQFKDSRAGVIESEKEINFKTFNTDLAKLGVNNALYTDMGPWDEGWYRDPKTEKIVTIGNDRTKTHKQSNWVVFTER